MDRVLDPAQLAAAKHALLSDGSDQLIELISDLALGSPIANPTVLDAVNGARALGWVEEAEVALTSLGGVVADPIREYRFWLDRGRRLHSEDVYPLLARESYRGKSLLEVGSGFGCNLFSLAGIEGRFVGVEPFALYRQFTSLLAEREGIPCPEVVPGFGRELPFADAEFDILLCYSAHQYMDIRPALKEMARVLRPGGQLRCIGATLSPYTSYAVTDVLSNPTWPAAKAHLLTIANTLSYSAMGRRLYVPRGPGTTSAPVYPPVFRMTSWMNEAGLRPLKRCFRRIGDETCFVAEKVAAA